MSSMSVYCHHVCIAATLKTNKTANVQVVCCYGSGNQALAFFSLTMSYAVLLAAVRRNRKSAKVFPDWR